MITVTIMTRDEEHTHEVVDKTRVEMGADFVTLYNAEWNPIVAIPVKVIHYVGYGYPHPMQAGDEPS